MKWMISEDKLGADQVEVIDEIGKISNKPIWIKGHAGSGKSVLLLHSLADYLVRKPNANVCVVVFTRALVDLLETGLKQIPKLADKKIPVLTIYQMRDKINENTTKFDAIFCDEIQDLPIEFIKSMKMVCEHLIISGDSEQSIYNSVPNFNSRPATAKEISDEILPIEKNLGIIYRLTESILNVLKKVFPVMLADKYNISDRNTDIKLYQFDNIEKEIHFCWKDIKLTNTNRPSEISAILISTQDTIVYFINEILRLEGKPLWERVNKNGEKLPNYKLCNDHLAKHNIPLMYVGNGYGSLTDADNQNKIVIMTYHSAKGLDFDYVYLPMVNSNMYIHSNIDQLLLVALSRSKSGLMITYTGTMYFHLGRFLTGIETKIIPESNENFDDDEIIF